MFYYIFFMDIKPPRPSGTHPKTGGEFNGPNGHNGRRPLNLWFVLFVLSVLSVWFILSILLLCNSRIKCRDIFAAVLMHSIFPQSDSRIGNKENFFTIRHYVISFIKFIRVIFFNHFIKIRVIKINAFNFFFR